MKLFTFFFSKRVSRYIEHGATVGKAGRVGYCSGRKYGRLSFWRCICGLANGLYAIEYTGR